MSQILYLHGYQSSPNSHKCQALKKLFSQHTEMAFIAPHIENYNHPLAILETLNAMIGNQETHIIGSSLGGMIAHLLKQTNPHVKKVILINPAVKLSELLSEGHPHHAQALQMDAMLSNQSLKHTQDHLVMLQKDDQTCPYQQALDHFDGCQCIVESGQGHGFDNLAPYYNQMIDFLLN